MEDTNTHLEECEVCGKLTENYREHYEQYSAYRKPVFQIICHPCEWNDRNPEPGPPLRDYRDEH